MSLLADGLLILATTVAAAYCVILSRRLAKLNGLDQGVGKAIVALSDRVDTLSATLADAKQALHMLHAAHAGTVDTPTGRVVVIEKLRRTPRDYPRRDGEPKRSPLGVSKHR